MYHTVLKLSSENKITAKNSWQLPLIDHMQSLIRGDMKGGAAGTGMGPTASSKTSAATNNISQKDSSSSSSSSSSAAAATKGGAVAPTTVTSSSVSSKVFTAGANGGKSATTAAPLPSFATRDSSDTVDVALLNFQRASCTLDASVKIWSCRVDDVYTSSFRVLENLSRTGDQQIKEGEEEDVTSGALDAETSAVAGGGRGGDDDDDDDDDGKTRSNKQSAAARAAARVSATIESNLANITAKRIDSSIEVDPMYARLSGGGGSSDTGEGAAGMLLCRLSVHIGCELAFDSSEVGDIDAMEGSGFLSSSHRMFPSESASLIEAIPINTLSEEDDDNHHSTAKTSTTTTTTTSESDAAPFLKSLKNAELAVSIESFHSSMRTHATMLNDSVTLALLPPPPVVPSPSDFRPQSRLSIGGSSSSSSSSSSGLFIGAVRNSVHSSSASTSASIAVAAAASEGSGNGGAWAAVARIAEGIESANTAVISADSSSSTTTTSTVSSAIIESDTLAAIDDALDAAKQQESEAALQSAVVTSNNNAASNNDDDYDNDHDQGGDGFGGGGGDTGWPVGGGSNDDDDDDDNPQDRQQDLGGGGVSSEAAASSVSTNTTVGSASSSLGIAANPAASGTAAEYTFVDLAALTNAAGGTGSGSTSSHWRFKANARKAAADVKQRALIAAEKAKGGDGAASSLAVMTTSTAKGKGGRGKKATGGKPTVAETKRALAAKGGLDFTSEVGPSADAFSKGKVPLAATKTTAASAKVGNIVGMAPTQRDAEQLQPAAVEKLSSKGARANTLPLVPGGATLGATLSGGACPATLKPLGPKALLANMHLFLRPTVVLPISTGIDEKDALIKQMERGVGAAGELLYPSARAAAARANAATSAVNKDGAGSSYAAAAAAARDDEDEDAGGGYWPSGGDDYDDPEYSSGGGGGGVGSDLAAAAAFVGNASSPMKPILAAAAAAAAAESSLVDPNGAQPQLGALSGNTGPMELISAGRHVEKIRVKYATVANRVDVHALKDDMRALLLNGALRKTTHKAFEGELKAKALEHERSFTDVSTTTTGGASKTKTSNGSSSISSSSSSLSAPIQSQGMRFAEHVIKPMVPSMSKEVSVSFYLITLLHLCNDHNLVLSREDLRDFEVLSLEERGPVKGL